MVCVIIQLAGWGRRPGTFHLPPQHPDLVDPDDSSTVTVPCAGVLPPGSVFGNRLAAKR